MSKNIKQVLPKEQVAIIKDALKSYKKTIEVILESCKNSGEGFPESVNYTHFDLLSLIAFMDFDVTINMPQSVKENFCGFANVDFPLYDEKACVLQYPVEEESKWVTILTGDFSFVDDGVHGRECHVNSINTIEKYLREDMGATIDDIERCGDSWIVVEDYDGSIEMIHPMKEKDEREFQVVWLATHYDARSEVQHFSHFKDDNGYEDELIDNIDKLEVGESTKVVEGVMVIRIF